MKIKQLQITIVFGETFSFRQHPQWVLLNYFLTRLKRMLCVVTNTPCAACPQQHKCIYADLTAANFAHDYPLFVLPAILMPKRDYLSGDNLTFSIYLIGRATAYADFFGYIANEMQEIGWNSARVPVVVMFRQNFVEFTPLAKPCKQLKLITPLEQTQELFPNFEKRIIAIKQRSEFINNLTPCPKPKLTYNLRDFLLQQKYHIGVQPCVFTGKVGSIKITDYVVWDIWCHLILLFGFSKNYWYGAGRVEVSD